jgi:hypothetical protein
VDVDDLEVYNPQTFTVTRAVNGVAKAQTQNTNVHLWRAAVYAL